MKMLQWKAARCSSEIVCGQESCKQCCTTPAKREQPPMSRAWQSCCIVDH